MLSLLLILILLILINVVTSYVPVRNVKVLNDVSPHSFILKTLSTTEPPPTKKKGFWEEFRDIFFGAFTDAFNTKEDKTKNVTPLNYANIKEGIFSKHKANSNWRNDDIIKNFASKYIPEYRKSIKTARLLRRLEDLDEGELLESLDEYMNILQEEKHVDPITASEMFIFESLKDVTRNPTTEDASKIIDKPKRFYKPLKSSALQKVLTKDPDYFNH